MRGTSEQMRARLQQAVQSARVSRSVCSKVCVLRRCRMGGQCGNGDYSVYRCSLYSSLDSAGVILERTVIERSVKTRGLFFNEPETLSQ